MLSFNFCFLREGRSTTDYNWLWNGWWSSSGHVTKLSQRRSTFFTEQINLSGTDLDLLMFSDIKSCYLPSLPRLFTIIPQLVHKTNTKDYSSAGLLWVYCYGIDPKRSSDTQSVHWGAVWGTYWVVGSVIASDRSSYCSTGSRMASSYKLKLLSVCTILEGRWEDSYGEVFPNTTYQSSLKPTSTTWTHTYKIITKVDTENLNTQSSHKAINWQHKNIHGMLKGE